MRLEGGGTTYGGGDGHSADGCSQGLSFPKAGVVVVAWPTTSRFFRLAGDQHD